MKKTLPPMTTKELRRYRRFRTWAAACLGLAFLFTLAFMSVLAGGGWANLAWYAAVLVIAFGLVAALYYARAGDIVAKAIIENEAPRAAATENGTAIIDDTGGVEVMRPTPVYLRKYQKPGGSVHRSDTGGETRRLMPPQPSAGRAGVPTSEDVQ